jgi:epoxyqueuosine reductase
MALLEDLATIAEAHRATIGVTDLAPFPEVAEQMYTRVGDGLRARLGFTYKDIELATDPRRSFPWGRSIVAVAVGYLRDGDGPAAERSVARFADGDRYRALTGVLDALERRLLHEGHRCEAVFDDDRLVDRAVAQRAGVGWSGKSTMTLVPGHGPWVLLGSIVTDASLPTSREMVRACGTCNDCIPACPTGAIVAPGVLDARRCLAAIFQSRGDIPHEVRAVVGGRIYGCDDCLTSCPPGHRDLRTHSSESGMLTARDVLAMSDPELAEAVDHWYVPGRKMRFVRRNALVAIGNIGGDHDIATVLSYLGHRDAMLRRHAAWTLGVLAPGLLDQIRGDLVASERDASVRRELENAGA